MNEDIKKLVDGYIKECNQIISKQDQSKAKILQGRIIAAFESQISGIDKELDFDWQDLNDTGCSHYTNYISNIDKLKCKLEVYLATGCTNQNKPYTDKSLNIALDNSSNNSNNNSNTNNNTNENSLKLMFEEAKKEIENNEFMSQEEIKEILEKINDIEKISQLDESKNRKWFKLRPTMEWLGTKGVNVAITVLGLITAILNMPK